MNEEQAFLQAMVEHPADVTVQLIFADWLEERGDPRGELLRLTHVLTQATEQPNRRELENRVRALLTAGVPPVGPFRTNVIGMQFAWVPPGVFLMGSPEPELEHRYEHRYGVNPLLSPVHRKLQQQHRVTLACGLWMQTTLVTQQQWRAVMGTVPEPSGDQDFPANRFPVGDDLPVVDVSWYEAKKFCRKLSTKDRQRGKYRLPHETEWEYAARAGTTTPFWQGETITTEDVNYDGNEPYREGDPKGVNRGSITPVRTFRPNPWGLHDMGGNVYQWCEDVIEAEHVGGTALRGGCWNQGAVSCRLASRGTSHPTESSANGGFRVVLPVAAGSA